MPDRWTWTIELGSERFEQSATLDGDRIVWSGTYINMYTGGPEPWSGGQEVARFVEVGAYGTGVPFDVPDAVERAIAARVGAADAWWVKALAETDASLLACANRGDLLGARAALDAGACIDPRDRSGRTPLAYACFHANVEMALALLERGAAVSLRDVFGDSPLGHAASRHSLRIVEALLWHGADPNAGLRMGGNALHAAVRVQRFVIADAIDVVRVLLEAGADLRVEDAQGKTPLDVARKNGAPDALLALLTPS